MKQALRIKLTADERVSFTVMFEPSGMTYDLGPSEYMFADIQSLDGSELEIVYWENGVSVWAPGPVRTLNSAGDHLDELN